VFRSPVPLGTIDVVVAGEQVEDALAGLLDHSLVRAREDDEGEVRFSLLALLRQYGQEQLAADPDRDVVLERHARHYAGVAERGEPSAVQAEQPDVHAALEWLLDAAEGGDAQLGQLGQRVAVALGPFWYQHGDASEGTALLERAVAVDSVAPAAQRAAALRWLGVLLEHQRRLDEAQARFEEALSLYLADGDQGGEAACLNSLGVVARTTGDLQTATHLFVRSLDLRRALGDGEGVATTTSNLALVLIDRGELDEAVTLLEEADRLDRASGDDWSIACTANNLGVARLLRGDCEEAAALVSEALRRFAAVGDMDGVAESIDALVGVAAAEGAWVRAARLAGSGGALRSRVGIAAARLDRERLESWLAVPRSGLGADAYAAAVAEGEQMTVDQAVRHALGEPVSALG
jgi:tetratricopeptide (TPR) repeat protein